MGQSPLAFVAQKFNTAFAPGRVDQQSALWSSPRHGKYYAEIYGTPAILNSSGSVTTAAQAGTTFRASNQSQDTISTALTATYTGICLSNPIASTVNLAVKRVSGLFGPSSALINAGLITGWSSAGVVTHTTPITQIVNGYVGAATASGSILSAAPQGLVDAACTLVGTPAWDRWFYSLASASDGAFYYDLDDDLIIPPGGYCAVGCLVSTTGFLGTFMWEELPQ